MLCLEAPPAGGALVGPPSQRAPQPSCGCPADWAHSHLERPVQGAPTATAQSERALSPSPSVPIDRVDRVSSPGVPVAPGEVPGAELCGLGVFPGSLPSVVNEQLWGDFDPACPILSPWTFSQGMRGPSPSCLSLPVPTRGTVFPEKFPAQPLLSFWCPGGPSVASAGPSPCRRTFSCHVATVGSVLASDLGDWCFRLMKSILRRVLSSQWTPAAAGSPPGAGLQQSRTCHDLAVALRLL